MAKVEVERDSIDIRVSLLERVMLAEKPRKVPLSRIRAVDPHPRLIDLMMHWSDQSSVWLCGVSAYDGHLIPSARNPTHTLALDVEGEERGRIYIEVDDEPTDLVAERIQRSLLSLRCWLSARRDPPEARTADRRGPAARIAARDRR
jgi:hypothetical protein